jgi:hypothetical protein
LKGETRPILLVEGEKTTDAAVRIMDEWFPMTMPGGAKAAKYAVERGFVFVVHPRREPALSRV